MITKGKHLLLIFVFLTISKYNFGQFIQFYNYADVENAFCIRETSDSNYIVAIGGGVSPDIGVIVKMDSIGNVIWQDIDQSPVASSNFVLENINGDYTFLEEQQIVQSPNIVLRRYNSNGILLWTIDSFISARSYGGSFVENYTDSSLTIIGTIDSGGIPSRALFIQCNQFGDTLFTKQITDTLHLYGLGIVKAIDFGFVIACRKSSPFNSKIRSTAIIKTDSSGNEIWRRELKQTIINSNDILRNFDNETYGICFSYYDSITNSYSPGSAFYNALGDTLEISNYSVFGNGRATSIVKRNLNGYIILTNSINGIMRLLYTDSLGVVEGTQIITDTTYRLAGNSMTINHNGQLVICGSAYNPVQFLYNTFVTIVDTVFSNLSSIEEQNYSSCDIDIYPVPSMEFIFFAYNCPNDKIQEILIHDLLGRIVYERTVDMSEAKLKVEINTNKFPSGVYIIRLLGYNTNVSRKFIKN